MTAQKLDGTATAKAIKGELADRVAEVTSANGLVSFYTGQAVLRQQSVRVLFAEDIDRYRVVLLSLRNDEIEEDRRRYALTYVLWVYGPRGATPEALQHIESTLTAPLTVDAQASTYSVTAESGTGTTFTVALPASPARGDHDGAPGKVRSLARL